MDRNEKIVRLTGILTALLGKKIVRAEELAAQFDVSARTIYRDMATLSKAGVPLSAEQGVGYSLVQGYVLSPIMFTEDEASALYLGGEFVKASADTTVRRSVESAMQKIVAVLPDERKEFVSRVQDSTVVFPRMSSVAFNKQSQSLSDLQHAIVAEVAVEIIYFTAKNGSSSLRVIEPLGMIFYGNEWHCIAYCRNRKDLRDFRVDRMSNHRVLSDDTFEKPLDFSLRQYFLTRYEGENPKTVIVEIDSSALQFAEEKHYFGLVKEEKGELFARLTFLVPSLEFIGRWLLSFGTSARILQPEALRGFIRDEAQALLNALKE